MMNNSLSTVRTGNIWYYTNWHNWTRQKEQSPFCGQGHPNHVIMSVTGCWAFKGCVLKTDTAHRKWLVCWEQRKDVKGCIKMQVLKRCKGKASGGGWEVFNGTTGSFSHLRCEDHQHLAGLGLWWRLLSFPNGKIWWWWWLDVGVFL